MGLCPGSWVSGGVSGRALLGAFGGILPRLAHDILSSTFRKTYTVYHAVVNPPSREIDARFRQLALAAETAPVYTP